MDQRAIWRTLGFTLRENSSWRLSAQELSLLSVNYRGARRWQTRRPLGDESVIQLKMAWVQTVVIKSSRMLDVF